MSVSYFWSLWCFKFKAPFDILLIYFLLLFASASFQQTKIIHRVNNTFQTTTETSFRAQFCSQMVHLYFHVFCTTHWSFFQMPTLPATILSVTVGRVYIIWYHIGIHQIHEKMVLWKTWSHLTTKYFLILHLGHESRLCFLVTPGMLSHGAVCVMASCMPPSLTGQLYSYICIKNYCFLWLLTFSCLIFVVYWCPISQAESRKYMFTISVSPSGLLDLIFQDRDNGLRVIPEMVFGNMTRLLRSTFSCLLFSGGCGFSIGLMKRMVLALGIGFSYHLQNLVMVPPPSFHFLNVRSLKLSSGQTLVSILCTLLPHLLQLAHVILLWYSEACTSWPTCIFSSLVVRCRCHMPFCSNQYFVSQPHFSQLDCIFWQVMAICKA